VKSLHFEQWIIELLPASRDEAFFVLDIEESINQQQLSYP
jgi:hypothetical protein